MEFIKNLASDNNSGIHPDVIKALTQANNGYFHAYGDDPHTNNAIEKFRVHFGKDIEVHFVFNGTAANILSIKSATRSYNAVICADTAHPNTDECGALENFTGCKIITIPSEDGKITVEELKKGLSFSRDQHHNQNKVISITQSTEWGTVYTPGEIKAIADYAHENNMYLHMDGARLSNAAAALNTGFKDITASVGVDVLSFGGTKNGLMMGEAVIIFNKDLAEGFKYMRKQAGQLMSKMRYMAVQFDALLSNDLWLRNARNANSMAKLLAEEISGIPGIRIVQKVEANEVFTVIPPEHIKEIQDKCFFYVWDAVKSVVRLVTSYDTTEEDVLDFADLLRNTLGA